MPFPKPQQAVSSPDSAQSTLTRPMAAKASFTSPLKGTRSINDPHCGAHGFSCLRMFEREQSAVSGWLDAGTLFITNNLLSH